MKSILQDRQKSQQHRHPRRQSSKKPLTPVRRRLAQLLAQNRARRLFQAAPHSLEFPDATKSNVHKSGLMLAYRVLARVRLLKDRLTAWAKSKTKALSHWRDAWTEAKEKTAKWQQRSWNWARHPELLKKNLLWVSGLLMP